MAIYRRQLRALAAALIAAVSCLILASYTWGQPGPTAEKQPVNVFRASEEALLVPQPAILTAAQESLAEEVKPRPANADASPAPEETPEREQAHQAASSTENKGKAIPEREDESSSDSGSLEGGSTPSPGRCDDLLALVNKQHSLPLHYVPGDLVALDFSGISTLREDTMLRWEAAESLARLMEAAGVAGEELIVASGYRSFDDQQAVHTEFANFYGEEAAAMISAPPGHSEHQLGTTVDFTNSEAQYRVWSAFEGTSAYGWLLEHAEDYGFVQSYEKGKEEETGYQAESWHYRYVGVENAWRLKGTGLSLQAFLLSEGVVPHCD